jgi:putative ABC transport system substrate-binding protein
MRRREFVVGVAAAGAWPLGATAQSARVRHVGVLEHLAEGDSDSLSMIAACQERLNALGWTSSNIRIDIRWSGGDEHRLRAQAADLVAEKPDVILGRSTPVVVALRDATNSIPIVFVNANDPIRFGFVQSLARPNGNITGFVSWDSTIGGKWLETLKEIVPRISRVGLMYNPDTYTGQQDESLLAAAQTLAIPLLKMPFRSAKDAEQQIQDVSGDPNSAVLILPDSSTILFREIIIALLHRHRLPAIFPFRIFVSSGGLAYYGTNTKQQYRQAAEYVDRILKGAKPADLPVQAPNRYELVINLKTAKAINLEISSVLLSRADEVVE